MDCDSNDKRDMLCQCFVEVVTESESKSQGVRQPDAFELVTF
jgi:hypothetical protein